MGSEEFFRKSEVQIEGFFQIDLFFFILNTLKSITKSIVALVLPHVIIALSDILNLLAHNSNSITTCRALASR